MSPTTHMTGAPPATPDWTVAAAGLLIGALALYTAIWIAVIAYTTLTGPEDPDDAH